MAIAWLSGVATHAGLKLEKAIEKREVAAV